MIFDSDLLIEFLARKPTAAEFIAGISRQDRNLSVISYLEVLYGCRNNGELRELREFVATAFAEVIPLSDKVSRNAVQLMENYVLSWRLDTSDALIAATALERAEPLATGNFKHFRFIPGLTVKDFRSRKGGVSTPP